MLIGLASAVIGVGALYAKGPDPKVGQLGTSAQNTPAYVAYPAPEQPPSGYPFSVSAAAPAPAATQVPAAYPFAGAYTDAAQASINYWLRAWSAPYGLAILCASFLVLIAAMIGIRPRHVVRLGVAASQLLVRENLSRIAIACIFLVYVLASSSLFLPIVAASGDSPVASELQAVFAGEQEANYRIACQGAGVDELSRIYANSSDYGWPSGDDVWLIQHTLGPSAIFGAGLLTVQQAQDMWSFHAVLHSTGPNSYGKNIAGGYCQRDLTLYPIKPHHVWVNAFQTIAVFTTGDCGTVASLFRKIDGRWKIVRRQQIQQCPGLS